MAEKALILFGILIVGFIGSSDLEEIIDRPRKEDEAENTIEQLVCLHLGIICQPTIIKTPSPEKKQKQCEYVRVHSYRRWLGLFVLGHIQPHSCIKTCENYCNIL